MSDTGRVGVRPPRRSHGGGRPRAATQPRLRRTVQLPTGSDLRVATKQRTLLGIGGDFFEVFRHRDGVVSTVMADVSGNGPSAATPVDDVRWVLRQHLAQSASPATVLAGANEWLAAQRTHDHFVTAVCVRIDVRSGCAAVASAGHLGPFVKRSAGHTESLAPVAGMALGIQPGEVYEEASIELEGSDAVVLVTDGVSDSFAVEGDWLGERALLAHLANTPSGSVAICDALLGGEVFRGQDATVVVLEMPAHRPRPKRRRPR